MNPLFLLGGAAALYYFVLRKPVPAVPAVPTPAVLFTTVLPDGSQYILYQDGSTHVHHPDGTITTGKLIPS